MCIYFILYLLTGTAFIISISFIFSKFRWFSKPNFWLSKPNFWLSKPNLTAISSIGSGDLLVKSSGGGDCLIPSSGRGLEGPGVGETPPSAPWNCDKFKCPRGGLCEGKRGAELAAFMGTSILYLTWPPSARPIGYRYTICRAIGTTGMVGWFGTITSPNWTKHNQ